MDAKIKYKKDNVIILGIVLLVAVVALLGMFIVATSAYFKHKGDLAGLAAQRQEVNPGKISIEDKNNGESFADYKYSKLNLFILEDNGSLSSNVIDPSYLTRRFYEKYPHDKYDFIGFHFKDGVSGGYTYSYSAQYNINGSFDYHYPDQTHLFGSKGRLLGGYVDSFNFDDMYVKRSNNDPILGIDDFYFSLIFHEITHYWGVSLPDQLKEALVFDGANYLQGHWEAFSGSWISVDVTTRLKIVENPDGTFLFRLDCSKEPQHHDFDLYSMGLKSQDEVQENLVITALYGQIPGPLDCDSHLLMAQNQIRKSYTIKDFISVLGPRQPSSAESQKNFNMAFVMIVPKGEKLSINELRAFKWIAEKFPIVWYKSTKWLSIINNIKPSELNPPKISNVKISANASSIRATWNTDEPSASFVIYIDGLNKRSLLYPQNGEIVMPPKYYKRHDILISNTDWTPVEPNTDYHIKLISIDENYNMATYDAGIFRTG